MEKSQTQNQAKRSSVQIEKGDYTFLINEQIIKRTGRSIQEITNYIKKGDFIIDNNDSNFYRKNTQEHKILLMCMKKNRNDVSTFSQFKQNENQSRFHIDIAKQLMHIQFQRITTLNLYKCNINNLQDLQFLNAPILTILQLFGNYLVRIQAIFKNNNIRSLSSLTLYKNKIKQGKNFSRALFPKLNYIQLQISKQSETSIEDLNFTFKLQGKKSSLNNFRVWGSSRIDNQKYRKIGLRFS